MKATNTPEFKRWFGDSEMVNEEGKPLVVYHGTASDFNEFRPSGQAFYGSGIYLSASLEAATDYADGAAGVDDPRVMSVYASIQRPYIFDAPPAFTETSAETLIKDLLTGSAQKRALKTFAEQGGLTDEIKDALEQLGHDGLIVNVPGEPIEYIAFYPTQIKSATSNNGEFDLANPNINE